MFASLIYDLLIILAAGLVAGVVCRWLQISVLVGYLVVGAIIGGNALGWVVDQGHQVEHIAEAGVFLLLFSIGLEFSLAELRRLAPFLVIGGSVQMTLVAVPVAILMRTLDAAWPVAILVAAATSFSSTVLVFKALSEWGHTSLPHGRRAIAILLFQDVLLVPLLLAVPMLTGGDNAPTTWDFVELGLVSALFVVSVLVLRELLSRWIVPLFATMRSLELIVLFTLVTLSAVTLAASSLGLPAAIGALAAGLIFGDNRWTHQIDALVLPLRETFAAIFFVSLGLLLDPSLFWTEPGWMLSCLAGLVVLKAAAATIALRLTGLTWQVSGATAMGLAHVGEFAFVLVLLGRVRGVISPEIYTQFITLAIGSLVATPLLLKLGLRQAKAESPREGPESATEQTIPPGHRAIVIGAGLVGRRVTAHLETTGHDVCLVDRSPINLHGFAQAGFRTIAGEATDLEVLELAGAVNASLIVVCIADDVAALRIVRRLRVANPHCFILVRGRYQSNTPRFTAAGASAVVSEEAQACESLLSILRETSIGEEVGIGE
ncbi:MAG: sodium:proton exchanger [Planctomycetota bacterium]|nr:MAG: sodium:proton exchanger [Planctomycetota bacterium]REJ95065.1 MAG: sodium:proton exchanger [Planctomycetota bacterium]REK31603.1 MAG: sodium:proton exchanger [Planctomycetota bacterium]REK42282.1 MAG: sodium:proton exchanger [Planctomycetota bacterium]